ncbi:FAD-binding oxidoreductase [Pandoraea sp. ISTKB]|uniref:FAD-binding oxidoreductase n=1 Tax=Pandoraea sp. ISTKB TaxID=1586708 RepID=UPI000846DE89|nr:FAD-binding oxidoreductase [Pandoraea sp. ISTKB]ODP30913.1 hydroxyacid dehydrogenase [Pandoraea sp. ISTKB]
MADQHLDNLRTIVGGSNMLLGTDAATFESDYRQVFHGKSLAVVRPGNTDEVSAVMRYCYTNGISVVPQGGNTSLLGGSVPDATGASIVISLARLNQIRAIDPMNATMTVSAGVTLSQARGAAESVGALFPLRIGSEGSCQIGGNLSTNAGGTAVLRYGNMRDLVLGLEVVLPDGRIWNGLRGLRKDNAGYDLKHLFIGSEGTLGIITAAVLKLFPIPRTVSSAFLGTHSPEDALAIFKRIRERLGTDVSAFELISSDAMALVLSHLNDRPSPLETPHPWYVLVETSSNADQEDAEAQLVSVLSDALSAGHATDAVIAANARQAADFWTIREEISDAQTQARGSVRCDISVPLSSIPDFIRDTTAKVLTREPATRMIVYGHVGDGNVHFNPLRPADVAAQTFVQTHGAAISQIIDDAASELNGSISAEHGVGIAKRDELLTVRSREELEMAWAVKRALDPLNLLNPGKVLPVLPD